MADTARETVVRTYHERLQEHNDLEKKVKDSMH